ncbi:MAG TPA: molybdopterin-binding protein [Geminicoccus sp.]|jgi:molybdenum cofactor synthesis domain-containing protein|uniref:competence/damage-inducible protein A n=1 Tax=Geminicoccus sp. TaxID=2024832 RepID=UPI002E2F876F|nr:molybdopterin-binding protein [Geminicoccus sp.]HEX2525630.1 molybdopterin-binding protein [Geminicoccus sp.]
MSDQPTAAVLIIGNEILSGRTQDVNLGYIARELGEIGVRLAEARVVPDIEVEIIDALNALRGRYTYVFTTGGIGPTHDDITSACVAKAFGLPFGRHPEAERRLLDYFPPEKVNAARMRMAETPEGAELIDNPVSIAPGFRVENVYVMAGVPKIMQAMFDGIKAKLKGGPKLRSKSLTMYTPEGEVAEPLALIQHDHAEIDIGSYPFTRDGRYGTTIVFRGVDESVLERGFQALQAWANDRGVETKQEA